MMSNIKYNLGQRIIELNKCTYLHWQIIERLTISVIAACIQKLCPFQAEISVQNLQMYGGNYWKSSKPLKIHISGAPAPNPAL